MQFFNSRQWSTLSNLAFLAPLARAVYLEYSLAIFLVSGTIITSFMYHSVKSDGIDWWWRKGKTFKQKFFQWLDTGFAVATSVFMIDTLWDQPVSLLTALIVLVAVFGVYILFHPSDKYEEHHGMWHVIGAGAVLLTLFL